jgi:hypothetical protein
LKSAGEPCTEALVSVELSRYSALAGEEEATWRTPPDLAPLLRTWVSKCASKIYGKVVKLTRLASVYFAVRTRRKTLR